MMHEPIDIALTAMTPTARTKARRITPPSRSADIVINAKCSTPAAEIVDEAFAGFTADNRRALQPSLVANLSAQLEALDQHREQLSQLLRSIDMSSMSQ